MRRSFALLLASLACVVSACASSASSQQESAQTAALHPYLIRAAPPGYRMAGAAQFPQSLPRGVKPFALTLFSVRNRSADNSHSILAIFSRALTKSWSGQQTKVIENMGPHGIIGYRTQRGGKAMILASRVLTRARLAQIAGMNSHSWRQFVSNSNQVAYEADSSVPGFGSLPMSISTLGTATSYVAARTPSDLQPSIVVGDHKLKAGSFAVLNWWMGTSRAVTNPAGRLYRFPAYATSSQAGAKAPLASLFALARGDELVLVRFVGMPVVREKSLVRNDLWKTTLRQWRLRTRLVRGG